MGAPSRQSKREQLKKYKQELEMRERRKRAEDANRICGITHENAENKGLSLVESEMEKLMHQDEHELLSVCGRMALERQRRRVARPGAVCQGQT